MAKRDSVTVGLVAKRPEDGALYLTLRSIEDSRGPPAGTGKYIRANVIATGTLIEPISSRKGYSRIIYCSMIDPAAYVPHSLIKMLAPQKAAEVTGYGKLARERAAKRPSKFATL